MQEQNVITREEAAKYGLRPILGFSSTKQLRQVYTAKPKEAQNERVGQ